MRSSRLYSWAIRTTLIFNPRNNKDDVKVFAAVATSWDTYYPGAERGKNLHNIAIEGMKDIRIIENQMAQQQIEASKVSVNGCIELALAGQQGTGTPPLRPQGQGGIARFPSLRQQREHQAHHDAPRTLQQVSCCRTGNLSGISRPRRALLEDLYRCPSMDLCTRRGWHSGEQV